VDAIVFSEQEFASNIRLAGSRFLPSKTFQDDSSRSPGNEWRRRERNLPLGVMLEAEEIRACLKRSG
jgi:hypothetical protein